MGKMLGCRVPDKLNETIRSEAEIRSQSVNEFLNDVLAKAMDGSPKSHKPNIKSTVLETARHFRELKEEIQKIENSEKGSFFGLIQDRDVDTILKALNREAKSLAKTLAKAQDRAEKLKGEEDEGEINDALNPLLILFPWLSEFFEEER